MVEREYRAHILDLGALVLHEPQPHYRVELTLEGVVSLEKVGPYSDEEILGSPFYRMVELAKALAYHNSLLDGELLELLAPTSQHIQQDLLV